MRRPTLAHFQASGCVATLPVLQQRKKSSTNKQISNLFPGTSLLPPNVGLRRVFGISFGNVGLFIRFTGFGASVVQQMPVHPSLQ